MNKSINKLTELLQKEKFRLINVELRKMYENKETDKDIMISAIGDILTGASINDSRLEIDTKDRRRISKNMDILVHEMTKRNGQYEESMIREVLAGAAIDKYNVDSYIMNIGRSMKVSKLTEKQVDDIVDQKLSGKLWSDRLWTNKKGLEKALKKEVKDLVNGKADIEVVVDNLSQRFNQSFHNTKRLVDTEVARVQDAANTEFAIEHGIRKQMFMATLDDSTSGICADLDGQEFSMDDKSMPSIPLHPNCRSVLVNVYDDWKPSVRKDQLTGQYGKWSTFKEWESNQ